MQIANNLLTFIDLPRSMGKIIIITIIIIIIMAEIAVFNVAGNLK